MSAPIAPPLLDATPDRGYPSRVAGLLSFVLHASATLVLAVWTVTPGEAERPPLELRTRQAGGGPAPRPPEPLRVVADPEEPSFAAAEPSAAVAAPDPAEVALQIPPATLDRSPAPVATVQLQTPVGWDEPISEGGLLGEAAAGEGRGASYFGIHAYGRRFVYIVDCSTSMRGTRWRTACRELRESLARLPRDREFYVLFFSDQTHLMFRDSVADAAFLEADAETIEKTRRWIGSIPLGKATLPLESLQIALRMRPDAIFLLSDGEFRDQTLPYIRLTADATETPIHTIALYSYAGRAGLEEIAHRTGGHFRFVTR